MYDKDGERANVFHRDLCHRMLNNTKCRMNQGSPNGFVRRWPDSRTAAHFPPPPILGLGESKSSMMMYIVVLNMSGRNMMSLVLPERPTDGAR